MDRSFGRHSAHHSDCHVYSFWCLRGLLGKEPNCVQRANEESQRGCCLSKQLLSLFIYHGLHLPNSTVFHGNINTQYFLCNHLFLS